MIFWVRWMGCWRRCLWLSGIVVFLVVWCDFFARYPFLICLPFLYNITSSDRALSRFVSTVLLLLTFHYQRLKLAFTLCCQINVSRPDFKLLAPSH